MVDVVYDLLFTEVAIEKLGRRKISQEEARQLLGSRHVVTSNGWQDMNVKSLRRRVIGTTAGGRGLTLIIEPTLEPTDWLVITGWDSANHERKMLR